MTLNSSCNLIARSDMAAIVDSLVAPLSVINALVVALCMKKQKEVITTLETLEQIWDEYQVTPSEAAAFRNENGMDQKQPRKRIEEIKAALRQMGNINVKAIEDYNEISHRH